MTDKKYTYEEIIKALECCRRDVFECFDCPLHRIQDCRFELHIHALDLINRLKAENERLENSLAISKKETKRYTTRETLRIEFGKKKW